MSAFLTPINPHSHQSSPPNLPRFSAVVPPELICAVPELDTEDLLCPVWKEKFKVKTGSLRETLDQASFISLLDEVLASDEKLSGVDPDIKKEKLDEFKDATKRMDVREFVSFLQVIDRASEHRGRAHP